jgi:hypothetical protein
MARTDEVFRGIRGRPTAAELVYAARGRDPDEEAADSFLGWLALYLPSWGTSFFLHVAVFLLAAFMVTQQPVPDRLVPGPVGVVDTKPPKMDNSQRQRWHDKRLRDGRPREVPPGLMRQLSVPIPDVASNRLDEVGVLGLGAGGREVGGFDGPSVSTGPQFFGVPMGPGPEAEAEATKIVYVVDRSGSMTDSLDYVKMELKRSLRELGPEKMFHIIFYSSGPALEMPARRLVSATGANRRRAYEFIDGVVASGETDPSEAFQRAFAVGPEVIYFLTDGEFDQAIVGQVKRANVGGKVAVNTIGFLYRPNEALLRKIAADNGGNYKFISEADLAGLAE